MLWNLINTILALVAIYIGLYSKKQFDLSKRQDDDAKALAKDDAVWAAKFSDAAKVLVTTSRKTISVPQYGLAFHQLFPKHELRVRIEAMLINLNQSDMMVQIRPLTADQLRSQEVRKTITDVLDAVENARRDSPQLLKVLDIP
jgi:hypothetical protein